MFYVNKKHIFKQTENNFQSFFYDDIKKNNMRKCRLKFNFFLFNLSSNFPTGVKVRTSTYTYMDMCESQTVRATNLRF